MQTREKSARSRKKRGEAAETDILCGLPRAAGLPATERIDAAIWYNPAVTLARLVS
jgi:hypothetical protein